MCGVMNVELILKEDDIEWIEVRTHMLPTCSKSSFEGNHARRGQWSHVTFNNVCKSKNLRERLLCFCVQHNGRKRGGDLGRWWLGRMIQDRM